MDYSEYLVWGPHLETGIDIIDTQHKILVEMCNQANRNLRERVEKEYLQKIVLDLMNYALYHFDQEEELMLDSGYRKYSPEIASRHLDEHRYFSETVANMRRELAADKPVSSKKLIGFLNEWLVNHIMNTDKELSQFLLSVNGHSKLT